MNAPVALAATAGMVAAVNPCGFSLLPAYLGMFVGSADVNATIPKRLGRAAWSALAVTAGFVTVFSLAGIILDRVSTSFQQRLPFVTLIVGALVVLAGVAVLTGRKVALPVLITRHRISGRGVASMIGFGVTYAVSSLSCTVGPFLAIVAVGRRRSAIGGLVTYGAYALGMGVVVAALAIGAVVARSPRNAFRRASRYAPKVGGVMMILSGGYSMWYARWELRVYSGKLSTDGLVSGVDGRRAWVANYLANLGPARVILITLVAAAGMVAVYSVQNRYSSAGAKAVKKPDPDYYDIV